MKHIYLLKNSLLHSFLVFTICFLFSFGAQAQLFTEWTGTGNWSNNANWNNGYGFGQLEFKGNGDASPNNDLNPASQWRLFFNGSQSYNLFGNQINLFDNSGSNSWVLSQSTVQQAISNDISFSDGGARSGWITTQNTGDLRLNGNIIVAGNVTQLNVACSNATSSITFDGIISGDEELFIGRDENFNVQSNTTVLIRGNNTYTADTFIDGGILITDGSGTLGTNADVFISSGTLLSIRNTLSVETVQERGFSNAGTINIGTGASLTLNGINKGDIFQNNIEGVGDLIIETSGTTALNLFGPNTISGSTTVKNGAVLKVSSGLPNSDVTVENGGMIEITGPDVTFKSLTINAGGTVVVNPGQGLTITGNLNNLGTLTLNSISTQYSSLIVNGTSTGNVSYNRHVNGNSTLGDTNAIGDNDLISAPVTGQAFGVFATANPNLLENPSDATEKAFAIFDKTTGSYENYFTTTNAATTLDAAVGYRAATNNTSTLTFTGSVNTGTVSYNIVNSGPVQADWNLIGNPYPSYMLVQDFLEHEVATGVENKDLFQPDTAAIYGYDGDVNSNTNSYEVYNLATTSPTTVIAPGQGFLVSADPADVVAYDVEFTPAMRTTGSADDFIVGRGGVLVNLELQLTTATDAAVTDFYFNPNASLGLDPGYDAAIYGGTAPAFSIYSLLVEDNVGTPFVIQALGETDFGDTTIALGVNANQGEQLTFSVSTNTLPSTVDVFLDDTVASTSTLLNSGDFVITPATALNGTGRFFLRFMDSSLSTIENNLVDLNIYANQDNRTIVIAGQLTGPTFANVYDIQGRLVSSQPLDTNASLQNINASTLRTGIYIVELVNDLGSVTEKVILK